MVRVLCLEDEDPPDAEANRLERGIATETEEERENPNVNKFSAALGCYPIVSQLARSLDLNSLHELSRTCRQVRANLLQYRHMLIAQSLRCDNENVSIGSRLGSALSASLEQWTTSGRNAKPSDRLTSGKVGTCARDLVGDCRRCGKVICRNCTVKSPSTAALKGRHRRLCRVCMKAPIDKLVSASICDAVGDSIDDSNKRVSVLRDPCQCASTVWLCQSCGLSMRTYDTTYTRGWAWRTRYSACGGIGAGIGEGVEGVECGRGSDCLAAHELYKELECDADELALIEAEMSQAELDGRSWVGSSYTTQEIVGIGGRVKKKVKKRMMVGDVVKEYEDERGSGTYLQREQSGANRSWCSWCERVVWGRKDMERPGMSSESIASSSSAESAVCGTTPWDD